MNKKMRIFRLLASHPIFLFKLNKSGFDECYQSAIKWGFEKSKSQYFQGVSPIGTQCEPMGLNAVYGGKSDFVEQIPQNHS